MQRLTMRSVCRMALLMGSLVALTGCFNRLNTRAVEQEIEAEIESQSRRLSLAEVRCPRDVYRKQGAYFRCVAYLRPEGEFTINVVQEDNQGTLTWDIPNSSVILNMAKVEEKIQEEFVQQFSKRATVNCGELYRVNQPGEEFECEVVGGVVLGQAVVNNLVVKVDPEGNLNWYEEREAIAPAVNVSETGEAADGTAPTPTGESSTDGQTSSPQQSDSPERGVAGSRKITPPKVAP